MEIQIQGQGLPIEEDTPWTGFTNVKVPQKNVKHMPIQCDLIKVVVSKILYFHPYLGKIPILTNIFQMG